MKAIEQFKRALEYDGYNHATLTMLCEKMIQENDELEAKASKWDMINEIRMLKGGFTTDDVLEYEKHAKLGFMIQWSVDEKVQFVQKYGGGCIIVNEKDLWYLQQLYDKRGGE